MPGRGVKSAYPNPFSDRTKIEFPNPDRRAYELSVYNMSGQKVREIRQIRDNQVILSRANLRNGFYVFELKGDKMYRGRFVVR